MIVKLYCIFLSLLLSSCQQVGVADKIKTGRPSPEQSHSSKHKETIRYAIEAKQFVRKRNYNDAICFFIDMRLSSGKKRFFVFDLKADRVITSGLVAHGSCNTSFLKEPVYSNKPNSGCSSSGKYKIGYKYEGRFGDAYKLYGLDSSNSNAFERATVLHSYECVPDFEMMDAAICNSFGCPMVSLKFFKQLSAFIDSSKKPTLLWIYSG